MNMIENIGTSLSRYMGFGLEMLWIKVSAKSINGKMIISLVSLSSLFIAAAVTYRGNE